MGEEARSRIPRVLDDRVCVIADPVPKQRGGIILPDRALSQERPIKGTVISVGPGKLDQKTGERIPLEVSYGDRVLFGRFSGQYIEVDGQEYRILRAEQIAGVVEDE